MTVEDPEIIAMSAVAQALTGLDQDAQGRVVNWAAARYGIRLRSAPRPGDEDPEEDLNGKKADPPPPLTGKPFEEFVDLYDAANPGTGPDRALAAGYWLQVVKGGTNFGAQQANTLLKDVGYGVSNITSSLTSLQERKPALVRQTNKAGKSVQARKTYKLTDEGIRAMKRMLRDTSE